MLFDVLSGLDTIKICTNYELDGKIIDVPPSTIARLSRCKPMYLEMPGWKEDISGMKSYEELPDNAKAYVKKIEELTDVPVGVISVGPDRSQTILIDSSLKEF